MTQQGSACDPHPTKDPSAIGAMTQQGSVCDPRPTKDPSVIVISSRRRAAYAQPPQEPPPKPPSRNPGRSASGPAGGNWKSDARVPRPLPHLIQDSPALQNIRLNAPPAAALHAGMGFRRHVLPAVALRGSPLPAGFLDRPAASGMPPNVWEVARRFLQNPCVGSGCPRARLRIDDKFISQRAVRGVPQAAPRVGGISLCRHAIHIPHGHDGTDAGARLVVYEGLRDQPPRLRRSRAVGRAVTGAVRPRRRGAGARDRLMESMSDGEAPEALPPELHFAYEELLYNLATYKAYLPRSCLPEYCHPTAGDVVSDEDDVDEGTVPGSREFAQVCRPDRIPADPLTQSRITVTAFPDREDARTHRIQWFFRELEVISRMAIPKETPNTKNARWGSHEGRQAVPAPFALTPPSPRPP
eukprot:gene5597-biopygen5806